jgi:hypothetical protein
MFVTFRSTNSMSDCEGDSGYWRFPTSCTCSPNSSRYARERTMAAKKCKCGRKVILETDRIRGRCFQCVKDQ